MFPEFFKIQIEPVSVFLQTLIGILPATILIDWRCRRILHVCRERFFKHFTRFLQENGFCAKFLQVVFRKNALSVKILQDISQKSSKIAGFRQLRIWSNLSLLIIFSNPWKPIRFTNQGCSGFWMNWARRRQSLRTQTHWEMRIRTMIILTMPLRRWVWGPASWKGLLVGIPDTFLQVRRSLLQCSLSNCTEKDLEVKILISSVVSFNKSMKFGRFNSDSPWPVFGRQQTIK